LAASDPSAAEQTYRESLRLDPDLAAAKIGLAALLVGQDRFDECRELIDDLESRGFLEPEAEKVKAELDLQLKGQDAGSVDDARAAADADPDNPQLQLQLAEALAAVGQYEAALETSLQLVRDHKQTFGEPARKIMVDVFRLLPDDSELTSEYRRKLASLLY
jgi:putative thioredoxin